MLSQWGSRVALPGVLVRRGRPALTVRLAARTLVLRRDLSLAGPPFAPLPWLTLMLCALTAACNVAQFVDPAVLTALRRSGPALRSGEWWRLATPLLLQDGGAAGTVFNLLALLIIGAVAEQILGHPRWLTLYVAVGLLSETVAIP